ncbi:MAG: hypothetical protein QOE57_2099 [Acidimicrobiaceae bacterium]|jgi:hypothetical protein|nr:hypothetical protein [Acidimicrobiaceae bacterium]
MSNTTTETTETTETAETTDERPEANAASGPEWGAPQELSEFSDEVTPSEPADEPGPCDLAR